MVGRAPGAWQRLTDVWVVMRVELARRVTGPEGAVRLARRYGASRPERSHTERQGLRRRLAVLDQVFPGPPNCYRRALLEMAFDRGAAAETLHLGLMQTGGARSGHAWLDGETPERRFDVTLSV